MLKLPKNTLNHPRLPELQAYLAAAEQVLRPGGEVYISKLAFDEALQQALRLTMRTGHLSQGLEHIEKTLDRELKGLQVLQEKTGQAPTQRLSRLLILSNDGSDRFYREAESILKKHRDRAWGCLVEASAEDLGHFTSKRHPTKALMIGDRSALERFFSELAKACP